MAVVALGDELPDAALRPGVAGGCRCAGGLANRRVPLVVGMPVGDLVRLRCGHRARGTIRHRTRCVGAARGRERRASDEQRRCAAPARGAHVPSGRSGTVIASMSTAPGTSVAGLAGADSASGMFGCGPGSGVLW